MLRLFYLQDYLYSPITQLFLKYFNDLCHKTYFNRNFGAVALVVQTCLRGFPAFFLSLPHEDPEKTSHRRKPALRDGLDGHHPGPGPQLADDVRNARQPGKRADCLEVYRPLSDHLSHPQCHHRPALHAPAKIREIPREQPGADHQRLLAGADLRGPPHGPPPQTKRSRSARRLPQSVVLQSGDVLERGAGILYDRSQHGYQADIPVDPRRTADGGAQAPEPAGRNGLPEIPDQPALLYEHAQQHPRADRHRHRVGQERRDRALEDDALRALRVGARDHFAQPRHPVPEKLHRTDAHPSLRQRPCGNKDRRPTGQPY